jgi:hypothetical protein
VQNPLKRKIDPAVAEKIAKADKGTSAGKTCDDSACPKLKSVNCKRFSEMERGFSSGGDLHVDLVRSVTEFEEMHKVLDFAFCISVEIAAEALLHCTPLPFALPCFVLQKCQVAMTASFAARCTGKKGARELSLL